MISYALQKNTRGDSSQQNRASGPVPRKTTTQVPWQHQQPPFETTYRLYGGPARCLIICKSRPCGTPQVTPKTGETHINLRILERPAESSTAREHSLRRWTRQTWTSASFVRINSTYKSLVMHSPCRVHAACQRSWQKSQVKEGPEFQEARIEPHLKIGALFLASINWASSFPPSRN